MAPTAVVIGSGFSSLSAASYMAKAGYEVHVLEKNAEAGGRARTLSDQGFTFDIGPTWYWMPDIFENYFADFGHRPSDYYELTRLDPSYRIFYGQKNFEDISASRNQLSLLFEKYQPGGSALLADFLEEAKLTYQLAVKEMAFKPGHSLFEFISGATISKAHLFTQSLRKLVRSKFTHPYLISLLEFPVLFLGARPGDIPAFYNFMNYADLELGTWYPSNGMYSVVQGMVDMALELGVQFHFNCEVKGFIFQDKEIQEVITSKELFTADVIISGADYHHTETLLPESLRNYSESYWSKRTFAPSALLFFVGLNKKLTDFRHHTLFFDADFDVHADAIYDKPGWPDQPLFYVNAPSITDPAVAPTGMESLTFLVPIAPGIEDSAETKAIYFEKIITRFEDITGQAIRDNIIVKHSYCVSDFVNDYNAYKGNAYGLANTLWQTGYFRPSIRNKKIKNLFYTGQLTVPGGGVPPAIISGKIVSGEVLKKIKTEAYAD